MRTRPCEAKGVRIETPEEAEAERLRLESTDAFEELKKLNGDTPGPKPGQGKKPHWLRQRAPQGERYDYLKSQLRNLNLSTVCEEAECPNIGECWNGDHGTATVMLMGDTCTRGCRFCAVNTSPEPAALDEDEPENVGEAVADWDVGYIVLTSVDRDDLPDGGASHFSRAVKAIKGKSAGRVLVECLAPDFGGDVECIRHLASSGLDVYAHNLETVHRLQRTVRDARAGYEQSLGSLREAKRAAPGLLTKTSLMLGFGESEREVEEAMRDARRAGVDILTLGQYLQPSSKLLQPSEYVHPERFERLKRLGEEEIGFKYVPSGPLVRSSYKAGEFYIEAMLRAKQA